VLVRIDSTIAAQPAFDPAGTDRTFRIFMSDYTQMVLMPQVLALAAQQRCSARFELLPQVANPQRNLERGEADLLVIPRGFLSPEHPDEVLYDEGFDCVLWRDSSLAQGELSFERYTAAGHVVMQPQGSAGESFEAWFMRRYGISRRVAVKTYGFAMLPALVVGTEHVATVHSRLAHRLARAWPLVLRKPPFPLEHMQQSMQWHKYRSQDPGLVWLRGLMHLAAQRMDAAGD
jgi:DNA-binding transcriptional LysR family regulator